MIQILPLRSLLQSIKTKAYEKHICANASTHLPAEAMLRFIHGVHFRGAWGGRIASLNS